MQKHRGLDEACSEARVLSWTQGPPLVGTAGKSEFTTAGYPSVMHVNAGQTLHHSDVRATTENVKVKRSNMFTCRAVQFFCTFPTHQQIGVSSHKHNTTCMPRLPPKWQDLGLEGSDDRLQTTTLQECRRSLLAIMVNSVTNHRGTCKFKSGKEIINMSLWRVGEVCCLLHTTLAEGKEGKHTLYKQRIRYPSFTS